jgi:hypothetical protein
VDIPSTSRELIARRAEARAEMFAELGEELRPTLERIRKAALLAVAARILGEKERLEYEAFLSGDQWTPEQIARMPKQA